MNRNKDIFDLLNTLNTSEEKKIFSLCHTLNAPIEIFNKNFSLLEDHLNKHSDLKANQSLLVIYLESKIELIEYMQELNRLIHNYVASSQTLVDTQRSHYRSLHEEDGNFPEYQAKIDSEFSSNPLCSFIKDLRNYFLHKGVPKITSIRSINGLNREFKTHIRIDKETLISSFHWKAPSKLFLDSLDRNICISDIFIQYHNHISGFQKWYKTKQEEIYQVKFNFVRSKQKEIKTLWLNSIYSRIRSGKGFSIKTLENDLMKFGDFEDAKSVFDTVDLKERGQKMIKILKKTSEIPGDILIVILELYGHFEK